MPSSFRYHVSQVLDGRTAIQRQWVLDVGFGFGKWGSRAREYPDIGESRYQRAESCHPRIAAIKRSM